MPAPAFTIAGYDAAGSFGVIAAAGTERATLAAYKRAREARERYSRRVAWYRARDGTLLELRPFTIKARR